MAEQTHPKIAIVMGSQSDWDTMSHATKTLESLELPEIYYAQVISAHRTPDELVKFAKTAKDRGFEIIIAGAGGAAHLPGMLAAMTELPVLGVPIQSQALNGLDSLLSIVQMPAGIPVATFAIGKAGAINAALSAVAILALNDEDIAKKLAAYREQQTRAVLENSEPGEDKFTL